jgi:hypothetical protein
LGIDSWLLFYKSYFIYGDLDYEHAASLKNYFFGFGKHPRHLTYLEKFTDFRKCTLDVREGVQMCRYGLINLAPECKDILMGPFSNEKTGEKFIPSLYLPKKDQFSKVNLPSNKQENMYDLLSLDISPNSLDAIDITNADQNQQGLTRHQLMVIKVGNFVLPLLCNPKSTKLEANFQSIKTQIRGILEHCEKVILNQISAIESSTQKKVSSMQAIIFNEVNRSVVYYPFSKFSMASVNPAFLQFALSKFLGFLASPMVSDLECHFDGFNLTVSKWNQRTILVYSDDKKLTPKDFSSQLATFRAGLSDIFI